MSEVWNMLSSIITFLPGIHTITEWSWMFGKFILWTILHQTYPESVARGHCLQTDMQRCIHACEYASICRSCHADCLVYHPVSLVWGHSLHAEGGLVYSAQISQTWPTSVWRLFLSQLAYIKQDDLLFKQLFFYFFPTYFNRISCKFYTSRIHYISFYATLGEEVQKLK